VRLDALDAACAPAAARRAPMVGTLRDVWRIHYSRDGGQLRWKEVRELPATAERVQSPYDPEAHYSAKRGFAWVGYKVHLTEVCDEGAAHLITHVETCLAMQPDMTNTAGIHERLRQRAATC
jgi:transposase